MSVSWLWWAAAPSLVNFQPYTLSAVIYRTFWQADKSTWMRTKDHWFMAWLPCRIVNHFENSASWIASRTSCVLGADTLVVVTLSPTDMIRLHWLSGLNRMAGFHQADPSLGIFRQTYDVRDSLFWHHLNHLSVLACPNLLSKSDFQWFASSHSSRYSCFAKYFFNYFFWPEMSDNIDSWMEWCLFCSRNKVSCHTFFPTSKFFIPNQMDLMTYWIPFADLLTLARDSEYF